MNLDLEPFWSRDLRVLFRSNVIPLETMSYNEQLNAISRLVILLSILGFVVYNRITFIYIGLSTLFLLFAFYVLRNKGLKKSSIEGFDTQANYDKQEKSVLNKDLRENFCQITSDNPFGNVLLTDIQDNPEKKSAPPSFNVDVSNSINNAVMRQTQILNPEIENTDNQIYGDLWEKYNLDNSLMQFYSTSNTRVTSDQGAFAEYLYGNMYSSKESGIEGEVMRIKDNYRHILN